MVMQTARPDFHFRMMEGTEIGHVWAEGSVSMSFTQSLPS